MSQDSPLLNGLADVVDAGLNLSPIFVGFKRQSSFISRRRLISSLTSFRNNSKDNRSNVINTTSLTTVHITYGRVLDQLL